MHIKIAAKSLSGETTGFLWKATKNTTKNAIAHYIH